LENWVVPGLVGIIGFLGKIAYRHVMDAFTSLRTMIDALGKRSAAYEQRNVTQHSEILQRLSHVEALVNGKGE